jgi:hypothetical protein
MENNRIILGMSKRNRPDAYQVLTKSNLPMQLAMHMYKWAVFPHANARNHWEEEMKNFLKQLRFKLSAETIRIDKTTGARYVKRFHYDNSDLLVQLDDICSDAEEDIEDIYFEREQYDPLMTKDEMFGNFSDWGYSIAEFKDQDTGLNWVMRFKGNKVVNTL